MNIFVICLSLALAEPLAPSPKQLPDIYLRPKPKARAGGADDVAGASFSVLPT